MFPSVYRYADILAGKLNQQVMGVEKSKATRQVLTDKIASLKEEQLAIKPEIVKCIKATKQLLVQVNI